MFITDLDTSLNIPRSNALQIESSMLGSIAISLDKLPPSGAECIFVASLPYNQYAYLDLFVAVQDEILLIWPYGLEVLDVDAYIDLMNQRKKDINILN